jgi:hypothetical protein
MCGVVVAPGRSCCGRTVDAGGVGFVVCSQGEESGGSMALVTLRNFVTGWRKGTIASVYCTLDLEA